MQIHIKVCFILLFSSMINMSYGNTHPNDLKILENFKKGLKNPKLLQWPDDDKDPCGPPSWEHVECYNNRVTKIQAMNLGLKGLLTSDINQLSELQILALQNNNLTGMLPALRGLSNLQYVFLDYNEFDEIPFDFFYGLNSIQVLSLDENPLNASNGWLFPPDLKNLYHLRNISFVNCNLVGQIPGFIGTLPSLSNLRLSSNRISGEIPVNLSKSIIQVLLLNDQKGIGMTGSIDVIASMTFLRQVWLHGNKFTGIIPASIGSLTFLEELNLSGNRLVGSIPLSLANIKLETLVLNNNMLMGPIPRFKATKVSYDSNFFCQTKPGLSCSHDVNVLLDFLHHLNYPSHLVPKWAGNDPCEEPIWFGLACIHSEILRIVLPGNELNGTLNPSLAELVSLNVIILSDNNLTGLVPSSFTKLKSLISLDLRANNFEPPLPNFHDGIVVHIDNNPLFVNQTRSPPPSPHMVSSGAIPYSPSSPSSNSKRYKKVGIVAGIIIVSVFVVALLIIYYLKKRNLKQRRNTSIDGSSTVQQLDVNETQYQFVISFEVLSKAANNFDLENELGRGGYGIVYRGELENGTQIAVKRMHSSVIREKQIAGFKAEIDILSKVRHRNLVSLLGYCIEGDERLLVYEYIPLGTLHRHLYHWQSLQLGFLSWSQRLAIALDIANAIHYLHNLAPQTIIHGDLKATNILLGDGFRAKVCDFGLAKLVLDEDQPISTGIDGTFGYMAPEYGYGIITTKVDVYSFGVVLMELITRLRPVDTSREEGKHHLSILFCESKSNKDIFMTVIDPELEVSDDDTFNSLFTVAELAEQCIAAEPTDRPDMGHAVMVLSNLVKDYWTPVDHSGGDRSSQTLPLLESLSEEDSFKSFGIS